MLHKRKWTSWKNGSVNVVESACLSLASYDKEDWELLCDAPITAEQWWRTVESCEPKHGLSRSRSHCDYGPCATRYLEDVVGSLEAAELRQRRQRIVTGVQDGGGISETKLRRSIRGIWSQVARLSATPCKIMSVITLRAPGKAIACTTTSLSNSEWRWVLMGMPGHSTAGGI